MDLWRGVCRMKNDGLVLVLCYVVCDASAIVGCDRRRQEDKGFLMHHSTRR